MRITIAYDSSWRNSFLDGSNNEPLPKGGRGFVGSMTSLSKRNEDGKYSNYIERTVTKDTVMGVLNRLIGDQRKLYQSRQDPNYCLADVEQLLTQTDIVDKPQCVNSEVVYIRNITGSTDQNAFTGMIKTDDAAFTSEFSSALWSVLWCSLDEVLNFVLNADDQVSFAVEQSYDPLIVIAQLESLDALKPVDVIGEVARCLGHLKSLFTDVDYKLTAKGQLTPISLYTSALYIQISRLQQSFDLTPVLTKSGGLSGISKRGFTKKDFMDRYTTGAKKLIWGNPYMLKQRIKGVGEMTSLLTKSSGVLEININLDRARASEIKQQIENAGVSAFYLGKKGLAYVEDIRV